MCLLSCFSRVRLFTTPWGVACQAPLSLGLSRREYWSGLPCPPPGDLPNPETEPGSLTVSCIGRWVLYHWCHLGSPLFRLLRVKIKWKRRATKASALWVWDVLDFPSHVEHPDLGGKSPALGGNLAAGQWRCQPVVEQPSFTEIRCWSSFLLNSPGWRVFFFFWHRHSSALPNEAFCKYKSLPFYSFKGEPLKPPGTPCLWEFQAVPAFLCPDNMAFSRLGN